MYPCTHTHVQAFVALLAYQAVQSFGPSDALSSWPEAAADWLLPHMAQKDWFPHCLTLSDSDLSWWKCVMELKGGSLRWIGWVSIDIDSEGALHLGCMYHQAGARCTLASAYNVYNWYRVNVTAWEVHGVFDCSFLVSTKHPLWKGSCCKGWARSEHPDHYAWILAS